MRDNVYLFPASRQQPSHQQRYLDEIKQILAGATPNPRPKLSKEESLITRLEGVVTRLEQLTQMEN